MQRSDEKLDFQPIDEEGRFSFDDYETVAEITFTKAVVESARNNSERLLSFCFQLTNSIEEGWYEDEGDGKYYTKRIFKSPCRSTSVGDIIQNMDENKYWVVAPVGFNRVFPPVNAYLQMARRRRELGAEEETPSLEAILDFVYQQFAQGVLQLNFKEIAQYFRIDRQEVNIILNEDDKLRKKYAVDGEPAFGDYFLRYKGMPMRKASLNGEGVFFSIRNPFVQARAKGMRWDNKKMRKERLRKIMFGADEGLEGQKCYMCGEEANYIFEDLPTGAKPFCTEKCLCDYAGFPYMGEGYYGLRPIGGEPFNVKRVLQNTGRLDWRKDFNAPVKKEIGAEGMIYFVLVPFSLAILGSIGLGRILNRRTTENNGDENGIN